MKDVSAECITEPQYKVIEKITFIYWWIHSKILIISVKVFFNSELSKYLFLQEEEQGAVDSTENVCCICELGENINVPSTSTQVQEKLTEVTRGLPTLRATAIHLKNNELLNFLNSGKKVFVHSSCRKRFTERKSVSAEIRKLELCK